MGCVRKMRMTKNCLTCQNKNCFIVYGIPQKQKKDCKEHHECFDCKNHNKWRSK